MSRITPLLVRGIFLAIAIALEDATGAKVTITTNENGSEINATTTNKGARAILSTDLTEIQCNYGFSMDFPIDDTKVIEQQAILQHEKSRPSPITPKQLENFKTSGKGLDAIAYAQSIAKFIQKINSI